MKKENNLLKFPELKLKRLFDLLAKTPPNRRPNVAILNDNEFLFSYKDRLSHSVFVKEQGPVNGLTPERGDVMDFFAQLEVIVNQIFVINVLKNGGNMERFEQILDYFDFFSKINLLKDWNLIDNLIKEKMFCLKEVRNGFAHEWNIRNIYYKNKPVLSNFKLFRMDALEVFRILVMLYNGKEINADELVKELSV